MERFNRYKKVTLRPLDSVCKVVNKLPFGGKLIITSTVIEGLKEKDIYSKEVTLTNALGLLGVFSVAHFYQGIIGVEAFQKLLAHNYSVDDPSFYIRGGIDIAYASGNFAISLSQARLLTRIAPTFGSNTRKIIENHSVKPVHELAMTDGTNILQEPPKTQTLSKKDLPRIMFKGINNSFQVWKYYSPVETMVMMGATVGAQTLFNYVR